MHAPGRFNWFLTRRARDSRLGTCRIAATTISRPRSIQTPSGPMANMGTMMVNVNLKTGKITTTPVTSGSLQIPSGMSAKVYGSFPSDRTQVPARGRRTASAIAYILRDHVENLQPFPIGTHVPHALGVFAAGHDGHLRVPHDRSGCDGGMHPGPGSCDVALDSAFDGRYPFVQDDNNPNQQYMFFKTILEANDNQSRLRTRLHRSEPREWRNGHRLFPQIRISHNAAPSRISCLE